MRNQFIVFAVLIALLLATGLVMAQEEGLGVAPEDLEGVTVTYWHEWDGEQQTGIDALIENFNANNAYGITVEEVSYGGSSAIREAISTGILSGELPNLSGAVFSDDAQSYFLDQVLVPLDAFYNDPVWGFTEEEQADLNQDLLDINRIAGEPFNGQLLSWPVGMSLNVLSVNLEMLEELGFDGPPSSFEEFREIACAAAELEGPDGEDIQGFPIRTDAFDMYSFIVANGGSFFDEDEMRFDFTNDTVIETLTFFQELYNDGCAYVPDGPFVNTADFAFGLNPMALGSSVGIPFIQSDIEASGSGIENWTMTNVPSEIEGERPVQAFLRSMAILDSTPEEEVATWLFLKYWASTEGQVIWTEAAQYQPYTTSGLEGLSDEFLTNNPQFADARNLLLAEDSRVWGAPQLLGGFGASQAMSELIVAITTGGQDVMAAAEEAEEEANERFMEAREDLE